jgi:hypothetical protein
LNYFNYFSEIEEAFIRRRGRSLLLSPIDWALIESWKERGVPLHIVLHGIENVFDAAEQKAKGKRSPKTLMYCRDEIESLYEEWRERQVGRSGTETTAKSEEFSEESIREHLETAASQLKDALKSASGGFQETLERAILRLKEARETFADAETLENALGDIEKTIDQSLIEHFSNPQIESEVNQQLAPYKKKMDAATFTRTFELMLLKRLREEKSIPRLSLFYL